MEFFPDNIDEVQIVCALRFLGWEYEQAVIKKRESANGEGLLSVIEPIVKTMTFHDCQEDNFAAFFGLQRFLFKWGGEHQTKYSADHLAFDLLFLHLYRLDPPAEFSNRDYVSRWNETFKASAETTAGFVRKTLRRRGRGRKMIF